MRWCGHTDDRPVHVWPLTSVIPQPFGSVPRSSGEGGAGEDKGPFCRCYFQKRPKKKNTQFYTHTKPHTRKQKNYYKWRRKERSKNISNRSPEYHTCQIYWYMLLWEWGKDTWVPIGDHALAVSVQVVHIVVSPPALIGVHTDGLVVQAAVILLSLQYCFNPQSKQTLHISAGEKLITWSKLIFLTVTHVWRMEGCSSDSADSLARNQPRNWTVHSCPAEIKSCNDHHIKANLTFDLW